MLNGKTSGWVRVRSGVPESSICGPIPFVLFCNDVPTELNSSCLMYADDINVFRRVRAPDDTDTLQTDLDKFSAWSAVWKLKLNPSKSKAIAFTLKTRSVSFDYAIHGTTLESVSMMRDLGVLLDSDVRAPCR